MSGRDKKRVFSMGYFSLEIFILRYWRQDQRNLRLSAHRRNHDSTLDWMLWESERVFNSRVFCYTKCRVCSQCNEITKEERGTKIIQHLNSTYNSALSLLHHTPDGNIFIKKMIMKHIVQKLLQCFLAFKFGIIWNVYLWTYMCYVWNHSAAKQSWNPKFLSSKKKFQIFIANRL